jgi:hypothetical protein
VPGVKKKKTQKVKGLAREGKTEENEPKVERRV